MQKFRIQDPNKKIKIQDLQDPMMKQKKDPGTPGSDYMPDVRRWARVCPLLVGGQGWDASFIMPHRLITSLRLQDKTGVSVSLSELCGVQCSGGQSV